MKIYATKSIAGVEGFATFNYLIWLYKAGFDIGPSGTKISSRIIIEPPRINIFKFNKTKQRV